MAVPKKKVSQCKKGMRRSHDALVAKNLSKCSNCGANILSHHICTKCKFYNGKFYQI
jgi:large subunit ribosomal protein L32